MYIVAQKTNINACSQMNLLLFIFGYEAYLYSSAISTKLNGYRKRKVKLFVSLCTYVDFCDKFQIKEK